MFRQPQLQTQLMQVALDSGVKVNSGVKVQSVNVAKTELSLADGETISADLIIAADGLHVSEIYWRTTCGSSVIGYLTIILVCCQTLCRREYKLLCKANDWPKRDPVHDPNSSGAK